MRVDVRLDRPLIETPAEAKAAEAAGFDAVWFAEAGNDPFLNVLLASEHTSAVDLGTAIAVAFGRSPLTLAQVGWDLNAYSQGRFILGLGSQVRAHIERRYSMPWSRPAARMRELVEAMRAIWSCWSDGEPLDFRGDFYTHTLMSPLFSPERNEFGAPRVVLAAVGPLMTRVAGEVADGLRAHSFTTERYLRERTLPLLEDGLARTGRSRADFEVSFPLMVATGRDEEEMAAAVRLTRERLAFYGSTPAYRDVLELHGWGDAQAELHALSRQARWSEMAEVIDDELVDTFAVVAEPDRVAGVVRSRYQGLVDRISLYLPEGVAADPFGPDLVR